MISGKQLLPLLIGAALGGAGWMQGLHTRSAGGRPADIAELENLLRIAQEEMDLLERENESLRSLAQGGGEFSVPQELVDMVERDYGLRFFSSPVVHRIAGEELSGRIAAATESRFGPMGVDDREEAWRWMGLLRGEDRLLEQLTAIRAVGAKAWFDDAGGEAWVTHLFDMENVTDQAALLRMLVRILLHQHFPPPAAYPGDDAARAREALHHGVAGGAEARFYAANARAIGFMPMNDAGAASQLLLSLPEFLQGLTMFSAAEGKGLADTFFVRGKEEFAEAMRNPPVLTAEVVMPNERGKGGEMDFPEVEDEIYLRESMGYLGLRSWLSSAGDLGEAEEIARAWKRDGYLLFGDGADSSALMWDIVVEDEEMAGRLERAALLMAGALAGYVGDVEVAEIVSGGGRFLRVLRVDETRVRFLHTATRETAENFGGAGR